uniref:Uncharacterized protein n=1 Tax=Nymphaea colorata TaxID=210225 RepID=A0A5K1E8I9_9MAGN
MEEHQLPVRVEEALKGADSSLRDQKSVGWGFQPL